MLETLGDTLQLLRHFIEPKSLLSPPQFKNQINLDTCCGPVKTGLCVIWNNSKERFDDKPLPTGSRHRVSQQVIMVSNTQQGMKQTTVPHIDLG